MKTIKLSDPITSEYSLSLCTRVKLIFSTGRENAWTRDFGTYEGFIEKFSKCHTMNDVNTLLNSSWTGTWCSVCGKNDDVVVFESDEYTCRVCHPCLNVAINKLSGEQK